MNVLDWVILVSVLIFLYRGIKIGFVQQIFGLSGIILSLILAFHFYDKLGILLANWARISESLGNILAFVLLAVSVSAVMTYLGSIWREHTAASAISIIDGIAGAFFGGAKVLLIWVLILLLLSNLAWAPITNLLQESDFTEDILKLTPVLYFLQERVLPANIPRLFITPEGAQLRRLRYEDLDNSTCIACGGLVKHEGLVSKGLFYYPFFTCLNCGRVSDGCQTYEGYHCFYRRCPWEGKTPVTGTNCQMWPNPMSAFPLIPCPVCGKQRLTEYADIRREILQPEEKEAVVGMLWVDSLRKYLLHYFTGGMIERGK